jgi:xanthine dehydrogenase/oxidase
MNGMIDIGQVEGAYVFGIGYWLLEKTIYDPDTGVCLNNGTWNYKPPSVKDIPIDFRVTFLENKPNHIGILGSKACGEPPLVMSNSIIFAVKEAIKAAREDRGSMDYFKLDAPATVDCVQEACLLNPYNDFKLF